MDQSKHDNQKKPQMPKSHTAKKDQNAKNNSLPAIFGGVIFLIFALFLIFTPFDFSYPFPSASKSGYEQGTTNSEKVDKNKDAYKDSKDQSTNPDYHEYDNFGFIAPGEWKIEMQGPIYPDRDDMRGKIITSSPYEVQITTSQIPQDKMEDIKDRLVVSFKETTENVNDYVQNFNGPYVYAGGWENDIIGGVDSIEAMYSILDTRTNVYTMVSIIGPVGDKEQVLEMFKSAQYKGMSLYK